MTRTILRKWERLERRELFAAFNVPWPEIDHLTLSFAPDGTEVAGQISTLHQSLRSVMPDEQWQLAILQAFQTWAVESNINLGLVDDNGDPFNTLGFKQGDVRFGDVRIGAVELGNDVVAVANPYDAFIANTWVGDVFLNQDLISIADSDDPQSSLYAVMLHEAGHAFGVAHNLDADSPMYHEFDGIAHPLTQQDRQALRDLYGTRTDDPFDAIGSNQTLSTATPLTADTSNRNGQISLSGDIRELGDVDHYLVPVPGGAKRLQVEADVSNHSLLLSRVSVLDRDGRVLGEGSASDPRDNSFSFTISEPRFGEQLYLRVESATETVFGVGAYQLNLTFDTSDDSPGPLDVLSPIPNADSFSGETLLATTPGYVEHTYYEIEDVLDASHPTSVFRVQSVDLGSDFKNVMMVIIASDSDPVDHLQVEILDRNGNPLEAELIPNNRGKIAMQIKQVDSKQDFLVRVHNALAAEVTTHYEIEVDFAMDGSRLETYVNETLEPDAPQVNRSLHVLQTQNFHFVLSATDWDLPQESTTQLQITDHSGKTVFALSVPDGATRSGDVLLTPGEYQVRFSSPNLPADSRITFQLSGISLSSPIGPQLRDTVHSPTRSEEASPADQLTFFWTGTQGNAPISSNLNRNHPDTAQSFVTLDRHAHDFVLSHSSIKAPVTVSGALASPELPGLHGPWRVSSQDQRTLPTRPQPETENRFRHPPPEGDSPHERSERLSAPGIRVSPIRVSPIKELKPVAGLPERITQVEWEDVGGAPEPDTLSASFATTPHLPFESPDDADASGNAHHTPMLIAATAAVVGIGLTFAVKFKGGRSFGRTSAPVEFRSTLLQAARSFFS